MPTQPAAGVRLTSGEERMSMKEAERSGTPEGRVAPEPRVLIAEDDLEMRRLVSWAVRRAGYQVVEVEDGKALVNALIHSAKHAPQTLPDLIISDVRMPGCTGLEVLARLRRVDWSIPVILITAFGDAQAHKEGARLGAAKVLDKPFDVDELCTAVQELVPVS
jgi:CheY-like chemotaxis protein